MAYLITEVFDAPEWNDVRRVFAAHLDDATVRVIARGVRQLDMDRNRSAKLYDTRLRDLPHPDKTDVHSSLRSYRQAMIPLTRLATQDLRPLFVRAWHQLSPPESAGADAHEAALLEEIEEIRAQRARGASEE